VNNEKIVVTGMGIIVPEAKNTKEFSNMLQEGRCGLSIVENMGPNGESVVGGVIEEEYMTINEKNYKRYPKFSRIAIASAEEAVEMAKINRKFPKRTTVVAFTSTGGIKDVGFCQDLVSTKELRRYPIHATALGNNHSIATGVASHFGIEHQAFTINDSCNAAMDALFMAKMLLESNQTDMVVLTGAETPISEVMVYSFNKTRNVLYDQQIDEVGNPFSNDSKGFAMSEGAGTIILEREKDAIKRDADIQGVIKRVSLSFDSISILQSDQTGEVLYRAVKEACGEDTPDFVNSQALGLTENDTIEKTNYYKQFDGSVPITTIKGNVGQALGAVGMIQMVSSILAINEGFIPGTIRTNRKGYEDLPIVLTTEYQDISSVLVTCHGFGGNNGCVFLEKYKKGNA
jgi:3-oxoacyl-[acyl-carrier-protein] synthase II